MKITYDDKVDALSIEFHPLADGTAEARPLTDEITANYGLDGQLASLAKMAKTRLLVLSVGEALWGAEGTPIAIRRYCTWADNKWYDIPQLDKRRACQFLEKA